MHSSMMSLVQVAGVLPWQNQPRKSQLPVIANALIWQVIAFYSRLDGREVIDDCHDYSP